MTQEQLDGRGAWGGAMGRVMGLPCSLGKLRHSLHLHMLTKLKVLLSLSFRIVMEASLHKHA